MGSLACETVIVLAFLLGESLLDDGLQLTTFGMSHLFVKLAKLPERDLAKLANPLAIGCHFEGPFSEKEDGASGSNYYDGNETEAIKYAAEQSCHSRDLQPHLFCVDTLKHNGNFIRLFDILILLFTGFPAPNRRDQSEVDSRYTSAIWSSGVHCHVELLNFHSDQISVEGLVVEHTVLTFCYRLRRHGKSFEIAPTRLLRSMGWSYRYRSGFLYKRLSCTINSLLVVDESIHHWITMQWKDLSGKLRTVRPTCQKRDGLEMNLFSVAFTCVMTLGIQLS